MDKKPEQLNEWEFPQWLLDFWFGQQNLSDAQLLALWWYLYNAQVAGILGIYCQPGDTQCEERRQRMIDEIPVPPGTLEDFQEQFPNRPSLLPPNDDKPSSPHTPIDHSPNTPAGTWPPPLSQ